MTSPIFRPELSLSCISFYYHMFGSLLGKIRISLQYNGTFDMIFSSYIMSIFLYFYLDNIKRRVDEKEFNQGNRWILNEILIQNSSQYSMRLIIESIRGFDRSNKMGLDDVSFYEGYCQTLPSKFKRYTVFIIVFFFF